MTVEDYNQCVIDYSNRVFRFIYKQTKNPEHSKDIAQESFLRLWERRKDVDVNKAKSYLFNTAYHKLIDDFRKDKYIENETQIIEKLDYSQYSDAKEIINQALNTLPNIQQSVLLLKDNEGYCYSEIGLILNLSEEQVKVYIYRARVAMKKYIKDIDNII